ncbi:MAG: PAS domain S-box protein, partial [Halothece sp. Uz-M2-17]|nr:PAS domain S-box protein [Halothece sp. Uz-M2-17]
MTQTPDAECDFLQFTDLQLFERLNSPIWIYDVQQRQILWANSAAIESWDVSSFKAINEGKLENGNSVQLEVVNLNTDPKQLLHQKKVSVNWIIIHTEKRLIFNSVCSRICLDRYESAILVEATQPANLLHKWESLRATSPIPYHQIVECSNQEIIVSDINDRAWNQLQLKEQTVILEAIATHQPLSKILKQLIRTVETLIPNRIGSFLLYNPKDNCLGSGEAINLPQEYLEALEGLPLGPNVGCCGTAAYRKEPVIVSNIATDPLWEEFRDLALSFNLQAAWSYPIFGENGALLGTFCCYSSRVEEPTPRDLELTQMISHLAGLAITQDQVRIERNQKLALVEAAVDGIGMVENDCFCYLNQAHAEIFGYDSSSELMGCNWRDLYAPEEAARLEQVMMPILKQYGYWRGNAIAQRKDGTTFPQELSLTLVDQDKIICVSRDISDRAATEQALQESKQRYQLAAEGAKVGVWDWNLNTNEI